MARSTFSFSIRSIEKSERFITTFLISKGYRKSVEAEGVIWKKGIAILTGEKCIKVIFGVSDVTIDAWISNGFTETDLTGFVGALPKQSMMKIIEQIKLSIE